MVDSVGAFVTVVAGACCSPRSRHQPMTGRCLKRPSSSIDQQVELHGRSGGYSSFTS
jgi:hypothetical protein